MTSPGKLDRSQEKDEEFNFSRNSLGAGSQGPGAGGNNRGDNSPVVDRSGFGARIGGDGHEEFQEFPFENQPIGLGLQDPNNEFERPLEGHNPIFQPINQPENQPQLYENYQDPLQRQEPERKSLIPQNQLNSGVPAFQANKFGAPGLKNDENQEVLKWKNINLIIIVIAVFLTIIFLQILCFAQNAVPQINGIGFPKGPSIAYFILAFVTLFILYLQYEFVNFGYRDILKCWRFSAFIYGVAILVLGILLLAIELSEMESTCTTVWATMSSNQKLYFDNSIDNLKTERSKNVALGGAFAMIVGIIIAASGVTIHFLFAESALRWKPPSTSRLPKIDQHEQVAFDYLNQPEEEDILTDQIVDITEHQDQDGALDREDDELIKKEVQLQQEAYKSRHGAIPGQAEYDPYSGYGTGAGLQARGGSPGFNNGLGMQNYNNNFLRSNNQLGGDIAFESQQFERQHDPSFGQPNYGGYNY